MDKTFPLVSVIIPTHNRPEFLKKTIYSILQQTYKHIEVIVVSNGKNIYNQKIVDEFNDSRLIYVDQENSGGPASPRNHGIRLSKGKYIAFCDDDDLWVAEKIEKQINALLENPEYGLCYTKMLRFDEVKEWTIPSEEVPADFNSLLYVNTVPISSIIISKYLLEKNGLFNESKKVGTSEDYEFLLRHALCSKFMFIDEYLIKYWSGGNRTTSLNFNKDIIKSITYFKNIMYCFHEVSKTHNCNIFLFLNPLWIHFKIVIKIIFYPAIKNLKQLKKKWKL